MVIQADLSGGLSLEDRFVIDEAVGDPAVDLEEVDFDSMGSAFGLHL